MATTAPANQRFLELDALRGFAVMGILAMNIVAFAMPEMAYMSPAIYGGTDAPDLIAWITSFILVDGKMRGLFSLLFGASMMLIIASAEAKGRSPAKTHYGRMFWLALFGLFHFFFIWWGDILFLYALIGSIAFLFRNMQSGKLIKWAIGIYMVGFVLLSLGIGTMIFLQMAASAPDAPQAVVTEYNNMIAEWSPAATAKEVALHTGSYMDIVSKKFAEDWYVPLVNPLMLIFETLPLMMIGMACLKNGFLLGQAEQALYRKWALWSLVLGGLIYAALGYFIYINGFDSVIALNASIAWSMPPRLLMTIGYAAFFMLLVKKYARSALMRRVAAAGRAAFTNYLGTSIVMTFIFYGWGLGLYGSVGRWELYLFVVGMWALMLLWSKPWLENFRYGPLEWLWRSLARGSFQPMRIEAKA
ncbi:DUF418 domain-containing protein [Sphingorhabdus sp. Alg239-R122]|uniref:DUF418 domain-containing protein n=1 Tax=Sphingorhabdus sp. Alg239-R122 TaxID=2305989 RepID=UPI0013DBFDAA|nr:DUF418 domain-containing protein [Sphingorhabdus sp. Alg239-R122]